MAMLLQVTSELPEIGFIRLNQVLHIIPVSKSTWWQGIKSGKFPGGYKIGNITAWKVEDIRALVEELS